MQLKPSSARRRGRLPTALLAATIAATIALAGCATHPAPAISAHDLATARAFNKFTVYWDGPSVDGIALTAADNLYNFVNSSVGFGMYYGNCEARGTFRTAGCTLPVKITTAIYVAHSNSSLGTQYAERLRGVPAVLYDAGDDVEMYTDHQQITIVADSPQRALAAVAALEPFNRTPTANFPAFPRPYFQPGLTRAELAAQAGASGPTGATSAIAPPAVLEPAPSASSK